MLFERSRQTCFEFLEENVVTFKWMAFQPDASARDVQISLFRYELAWTPRYRSHPRWEPCGLESKRMAQRRIDGGHGKRAHDIRDKWNMHCPDIVGHHD